MPCVYLLHLGEGMRRGEVPIRHYLGATSMNLRDRLERHKTNRGAALLKEVNRRNIEIKVARVWYFQTKDEAFNFEIQLKQRRNHADYCLFCKGRQAIINPPRLGRPPRKEAHARRSF